MKNILVFLGLAVFPAYSFSSDWTMLDVSRYPKIQYVQVDKASITKDGDKVLVWFRMAWKGQSPQQYLSEYDCKRRMSTDFERWYIAADGTKQSPISGGGTSGISPDTPNEVVYNYVCRGLMNRMLDYLK